MEPVNLFDLATRQSQWLAVRQTAIAGNVANANTPGYLAHDVEPFERVLERTAVSLNATQEGHLGFGAIDRDRSAFPLEFQPGNIAADENGYVKLPNVNVLIEMADMTEANRSYEANLQVIRQARDLISMTIDLMRTP
jgi:flagellar basal-body rod protein FlgC